MTKPTKKYIASEKGPEVDPKKIAAAGKKVQTAAQKAAKKPTEVIRAIAEVHNLDPKDINSEVYEDRPLIAETDLSVTVLNLCQAGKHEDAAKAIEIAVRRAHQVEGAK